MLTRDVLTLTGISLIAHRMRSFLTALGIAVGITAVVLLTSIGEGLHHFVLSEFSQFGTTLVFISPGKAITAGTSMGVFGTERPLTIDDSEALKRLPYVRAVVPVVQGNAEVEAGNRRRRTTVNGVGPQMLKAFNMTVKSGRFLPDDDPTAPRAFAVLGSKLRQELFGEHNPLGQRLTIGGRRYRVIGVMEAKGTMLGLDLDDTVYIPTARAMYLFNRDSLVEVDVRYREDMPVDKVVEGIERILETRHGKEDFTITTQQQMLDVLGSVLDVLTIGVGALGSISLVVGTIGIITIMTIAVNERTNEIGLLRALGATHEQVLSLFLGEAVVLAAVGGMSGLVLGIGGAQMLHFALPTLPVHTPLGYIVLSEVMAVVIGLVAGILPARRAAQLDPVEALRTE
jgi:putative ABC transport system permease protein